MMMQNRFLATLAASLVTAIGVAGCASTEKTAPRPAAATRAQGSEGERAERLAHHRKSVRGDFLARRAAFVTTLTRDAPTLTSPPEVTLPPGATRVTYESAGQSLWGWYAAPATADENAPVGALLYLHGGPALRTGDFERLRPFVDEGVAVLAATLRGRNGNGGRHELLLGEVDDAKAAAAWLAARPEIDARRVYVFGHSLGGGAAALLSLDPDAPVRLTAGCGAMYSTQTFAHWRRGHDADLVRFDVNDIDELEMRLLLPHVEQIVHPHYAYMGNTEAVTFQNASAAKVRADAAMAPLYIDVVPGNHMSALHPALIEFRNVMRKDALRASNDEAPAPPME